MIAAEVAAQRRRHRLRTLLRLRAGELVDDGVGGADRIRGGDGVHASLVARQVARVLTAHRSEGPQGWTYPAVRVEVAPAARGLPAGEVARRAGALLGFSPGLPDVRIVANARLEAGFRVAAVESFWEMRTADATRVAERPVATLHGRERELAVPAGGLTLGRTPDRPGTVEDERVSRSHASVGLSGGRVTVADLGSRNGTFVNDVRVTVAALADGDTLRVGTTSFRISVRERPEEATVPRPRPIREAQVDALLERWWAGETDPAEQVVRAMRELRALVPAGEQGRQDHYLRALVPGDAVSVGALRRARQVRNAVEHRDLAQPSAADVSAALRTIRSFLLSLPNDMCPPFGG